jgi:hypothetical protein
VRPLLQALCAVGASLERHTTGDLLVKKMIYPRVTIWIGAVRAEFEMAIKGPVRIRLNEAGEPVADDPARSTTVPLATVARVTPDDRFLDRDALPEGPDIRAA